MSETSATPNTDTRHAARTERVILVVWDGMRPDFVADDLTPRLRRLMRGGATYSRAVGVFPSVTRPTTTSVGTGTYPLAHGVFSNQFTGGPGDREDINTGDRASLERLRAYNGGRIVPPRTLAESLVAAGKRVVSMGSGSTGQVTCLDGERVGEMVHLDFTHPEALMGRLVERLGPVPGRKIPVQEANDWLVRALTDYVLPEMEPDVTLIWLCEPDASQHGRGLGAPDTLDAIRGNDARLGRVLDAVDASGVPTAVIVASDHGHSTVTGMVRMADGLASAGFGAQLADGLIHLAEKALTIEPHPGADDLRREIGAWLLAQPFVAAVVGWPDAGDETLPPDMLTPHDLYGPRPRPAFAHAPTFSWSLAWENDAANEYGVRGTAFTGFSQELADFDKLQGPIVGLNRLTATHGTLAPADQRTVLALHGAGIRPGAVNVPAGVVDIAPTILALLGLPPLPEADGRALTEAFADGPAPESVQVTTETLATLRNGAPLRRHTVGTTAYVDTTPGE